MSKRRVAACILFIIGASLSYFLPPARYGPACLLWLAGNILMLSKEVSQHENG